jgi:hypothetical protein
MAPRRGQEQRYMNIYPKNIKRDRKEEGWRRKRKEERV